MQNEFERIAAGHGDRLKVIPIGHLKELKGIIGETLFEQQTGEN